MKLQGWQSFQISSDRMGGFHRLAFGISVSLQEQEPMKSRL